MLISVLYSTVLYKLKGSTIISIYNKFYFIYDLVLYISTNSILMSHVNLILIVLNFFFFNPDAYASTAEEDTRYCPPNHCCFQYSKCSCNTDSLCVFLYLSSLSSSSYRSTISRSIFGGASLSSISLLGMFIVSIAIPGVSLLLLLLLIHAC